MSEIVKFFIAAMLAALAGAFLALSLSPVHDGVPGKNGKDVKLGQIGICVDGSSYENDLSIMQASVENGVISCAMGRYVSVIPIASEVNQENS